MMLADSVLADFMSELDPNISMLLYGLALTNLDEAIIKAMSASEFVLASHPLALCCLTFSSHECGSLSRLYYLNLICW